MLLLRYDKEVDEEIAFSGDLSAAISGRRRPDSDVRYLLRNPKRHVPVDRRALLIIFWAIYPSTWSIRPMYYVEVLKGLMLSGL